MKKKIISVLSVVIGFVSLYSCDLIGKIDDIKPSYQLEEDNVIWDEASANSVLRSVYEDWRARGISVFRPHMSFYSGALLETAGIEGDEGFLNNNVQADNIAISNLYSALYTIINSANTTISLLEKDMAAGMSLQRKVEMIAECKFHRAMAHFYLLRHFGQFYDETSAYGIIIRNAPFKGNEISARDNVANVYSFILEDLEDAVKNAPDRPTLNQHYYISKTTAKALKAKVLLYRKNYPEAARLAEEVINEATQYGYDLEDNYNQIFINGYNSPEVLFAPYAYGENENLSVDMLRTKYGSNTQTIADQLVPGDGDLLLQTGFDIRFVNTFLKDFSNSETDDETKDLNNKYPHSFSNYGDVQKNTYFYLRLGEIYLIAAEAEARQSGSEHMKAARNYLKYITDRAEYSDSYVNTIPDAELLNTIRQHKWMELVSENYEEWFDLVRYHIAGDLDISTVQATIKNDRQLILPIPENALSGNHLLKQNP